MQVCFLRIPFSFDFLSPHYFLFLNGQEKARLRTGDNGKTNHTCEETRISAGIHPLKLGNASTKVGGQTPRPRPGYVMYVRLCSSLTE